MKHLKHIKWIVTFITVLFIADRLGGLALQSLLRHSHFRYVDLYEGRINTRVLGLGDSRGVNTVFDDQLFTENGIDCYNLSFNGMAAKLSDILFRDYLEKNPPPELIIMNVSMADKDPVDVIMNQEYKHYLPYSKRLQGFMQKHNRWVYAGTQLSHLYRYNSRQFFRSLYYLDRTDQGWGNNSEILPGQIDQINKYKLGARHANVESLVAMKSIITVADDLDIPVRLVFMPFHPAYLKIFTNLDAWIATVEKALGRPVWDYSAAVTADSLFANSIHVNLKGRQALIRIMIQDGLFNLGE